MKLKRLKILSKFRGLPKNFEIKFNSKNSISKLMEPICFVGLNGSGKSNVMEVLSEIFYYLEWSSKVDYNNKKQRNRFLKLKNVIGFEIEYSLPKSITILEKSHGQMVDAFLDSTNKHIFFKIRKYFNEETEVFLLKKNRYTKLKIKNRSEILKFLPPRIIGYSSGMNELISNPYFKIDFSYFNDFQKKSGESADSTLDMNRMYFMDYDSNKLVTICNFLFDDPQDKIIKTTIEPIKSELQIVDLHSFTVKIVLRKSDGDRIKVPSQLHIAIEGLIKCASCVDDNSFNEKNEKVYDLTLYFWINDATRSAFKHHFKTASELFRQLYFLRLTNHYLISAKLRSEIEESDLGENISALIPKHEESKLIFSINDIAFRKKNVEEPVYYKQLSDGEHQLLHVLGLVLLLDSPGTLFLLDEPETHFNPEWRSKFVSILNECLGDEPRQQEMLLTSHSPFVVSDCKPEKVYSFSRNRRNNVVYKQPDFNTFGASVNLINFKVFGKKETISGLAKSRIENLIAQIEGNRINKNDALKEIESLGDSIEKRIFLNNLNKN